MAQPTSLSAQMARNAAAEKTAEEKEDAVHAALTVEAGYVWARLIRPYYDSNGVLNPVGVVKLAADAVPESAVILTGAALTDAESEAKFLSKKIARAQTSEPGERVNDDL